MMFSLAAMPWLESATRPNAATTDVSPTSSGMSAPTSDPSTIRRMMIVSGIEIMPALPRPPWISLSSAFSVDDADVVEGQAGMTSGDLVDGGGELVDVDDSLLIGSLGCEPDHR